MQKNRLLTVMPLVLVVMIQLTGLFDHSLWTPDEPRVAEICREMAAGSDYLIPHFVGQPFLEQPPLYYACAAAFLKVFGCSNEGFGRLASFIFALGTLLVVFWGTRRLFSKRSAALAVLMLSSSVCFFQASHKMLVDNALCFAITLALFAFILAYAGQLRNGYRLFWLGLGLAFLSKGLIGVAIPAVAVVLFMVWQKDFAFRKLEPIGALLFVGLPLLAFELALWQRGGLPYLWTFNVYNQLGRFVSGSLYEGGHVRPFYYYLTNLWLEGAPWSLLLVPLLFKLRRPDTNTRFLLTWFGGGILLLSCAATKRGLYLLPLMPAMAVLLAVWTDQRLGSQARSAEKITLGIIIGLTVAVNLALPFVYVVKLGGSPVVAAVALALTLTTIVVLLRLKRVDVFSSAVLAWLVVMAVWVPALSPVVDQHKTYKEAFVNMGRQVGGRQTVGYMLNESTEAFAAYYGGFYVSNLEDEGEFLNCLKNGAAEYLIILPNRLGDGRAQAQLRQRAERVLVFRTKYVKPIELWRRIAAAPRGPLASQTLD